MVAPQTVAVGPSEAVPFEVAQAGTVHVVLESRDGVPFSFCVAPGGAAEVLVCRRNVRQASEALALTPGPWRIDLDCLGSACAVDARVFTS